MFNQSHIKWAKRDASNAKYISVCQIRPLRSALVLPTLGFYTLSTLRRSQ